MATTRAAKISTADLQFAEEALEVFRLGDTPLPPHATPSMRKLYEWVCNPENYDTFVKTTLKQATDILAKHRQPQEQDFIVTAEKKGVSELQEFLRQHIEESQHEHRSRNEIGQTAKRTWINRDRPATIDPSLLAGVQGGDLASESGSSGGGQRGSAIEGGV